MRKSGAGFRNITAVEYLTMAHIFGLNAAIMAHGRTIGWANEPPLNTNEYTLMQAGKEVCMTATYVARTVLAWWFWVSRYDQMLCSNYQGNMSGPEETYAFFFWKVQAFGWFRIVSIVILGASALHIPCVMVVLEESVASSVYCRSSLVVFAYCTVGAELTLLFNQVGGVYEFNFECVAEVLAVLVGCKCFIWGAFKPDREADPLVLLNSHASNRVPVSWPYAGVDLQGVCEVLKLAWIGPGSGDRGSASGASRVALAGSATNESLSSAATAQQAQQARQHNLAAAIPLVPPATPRPGPASTNAEISLVDRPPPQSPPPLPSSPSHHPPAAAVLVLPSPSPPPPQPRQVPMAPPPQPPVLPPPLPPPPQPPLLPPASIQPPLIQAQLPLHVENAEHAVGDDAAIG